MAGFHIMRNYRISLQDAVFVFVECFSYLAWHQRDILIFVFRIFFLFFYSLHSLLNYENKCLNIYFNIFLWLEQAAKKKYLVWRWDLLHMKYATISVWNAYSRIAMRRLAVNYEECLTMWLIFAPAGLSVPLNFIYFQRKNESSCLFLQLIILCICSSHTARVF